MLDGDILAAEAVGADEVIVCACESADTGIESVTRAIEERAAAGSERSPSLRVATVPAHYVAGQESVLVSYLNAGSPGRRSCRRCHSSRASGAARHSSTTPRPVAPVALIARHGALWFRQLGAPSQPGSTLVTLSGPLAHHGVYEIEHGASLSSLIQAAGGTTTQVRVRSSAATPAPGSAGIA